LRNYEPNYEAMFKKAIIALAKIDEALGVPEDSCNTTEQTIAAIELLLSKISDAESEIQRLNYEIECLLGSRG
jgi:hypothetical protein